MMLGNFTRKYQDSNVGIINSTELVSMMKKPRYELVQAVQYYDSDGIMLVPSSGTITTQEATVPILMIIEYWDRGY